MNNEKDTFMTVNNMKVCTNVFETFMMDKYDFDIHRDGKNTNVKKLLFDVMTDVYGKHNNTAGVSLKDMNNITLNIARDYFKANYKLNKRAPSKPHTRSLERDQSAYGPRFNITEQLKPEPTFKKSVDDDFARLDSARKKEKEIIPPIIEGMKPIMEQAYDPAEFMQKIGQLEQMRDLTAVNTSRLNLDASLATVENDPKALYEASVPSTTANDASVSLASPDSIHEHRKEFIAAPVNQVILLEKYLSINGFDRNWAVDSSRFNFRVDFNYGDNSIQQRYRNIKTIKTSRVIIPMEIAEAASIINIPKPYYNYDFRFSFPYIMMNIEEFGDVYDGTNDNVRRCFCQLVFDKCYKAPNGRGYLILAPMQHEIKTFHPTPLPSFTKMTISLRRPNGELFNDSKDEYKIFKVEYELYNKQYLKIVTDKYFDKNEFYKGDTVILKGYTIDNDLNTSPSIDPYAAQALMDFVNNPAGHEILEMGQANDSGFYRNFYINAPGKFDTALGLFAVDAPLITNLNIFNDRFDFASWTANNGSILNSSLQCAITFKVQTVATDPGIINTSYDSTTPLGMGSNIIT